MDAATHDRTVAWASHLPQLLSTALAALLRERATRAPRVAGPGLMDMTRLAMSSYDLWKDIVDTNREEIAAALQAFAGRRCARQRTSKYLRSRRGVSRVNSEPRSKTRRRGFPQDLLALRLRQRSARLREAASTCFQEPASRQTGQSLPNIRRSGPNKLQTCCT